MTAFAAVLSYADDRIDPGGIAAVGGALTPITASAARTHVASECALILAPLHAGDPAGPLVDRESGVAIAGQVVLERPGDLVRELRVPAGASDLAIVLAAFLRWRERCAERLTGEYAFSVWDAGTKTLLCARDGLGVRLVYVAEGRRAVVVSNVLDAAVAHPAISAALDERALVSFIAHGELDPDRTPYQSIKTLPAGHTLVICAGRASLTRHWSLPAGRRSPWRRQREILDGYRAVLGEAVADRVRGGPAAILLSGGLDSTTIAAAARAAAPGAALHAFTATYPRFSRVDELPLARQAGAALGIPVTAVIADRYEALDACVNGAPIPRPVDEPALTEWRGLLTEAAGHSTVALYGEDGDALFLPPGFRGLREEQSLPMLVSSVLRYVAAEGRLPYLGVRLRERLHGPFDTAHGRQPSPDDDVPHWLTQIARTQLEPGDGIDILGARSTSALPHATRPDMQRRLENPIAGFVATVIAPELTRQRLELRLPLLDSRVLEFVVNVPGIPWCQEKALPRRAFRGHLPESILRRPKTPLAGFDDRFIASWRASGQNLARLVEPIEAWVDHAAWRRALEQGGWQAVAPAWRVIQLNAWLQRRRGASRREDGACIA